MKNVSVCIYATTVNTSIESNFFKIQNEKTKFAIKGNFILLF